METIKLNLTLDVSATYYELICASRFENKSKEIVATLVDNGVDYIVPEGSHVYFEGHKANNKSFIKECTYSSNVVRVELDDNILYYAGTAVARFVIYSGDNSDIVLATPNVRIRIQDDPCYDKENLEKDSSAFTVLLKTIYDTENKTMEYMNTSSDYATASKNSAILSESYAIGGTETREGEDEDNSKYYSELAKSHNDECVNLESQCATHQANCSSSENAASASESAAKASEDKACEYMESSSKYAKDTFNWYNILKEFMDDFGGVLYPRGTITFEELTALVDVGHGDMYNISNNFVTDDTFRPGAGLYYSAGTNVYRTADDQWDCLMGEYPVQETVDIDFDVEW